MCTKELPIPRIASENYLKIVAQNLKKLLDSTDYTQNSLAEQIKELGIDINQGTISKYVNGSAKVQLSVIVKLCEIFNISITDLVDENFQYNSHTITTDTSGLEKVNINDSNLVIPKLGKKFITNPQDEDFDGYLQKYHCYFFPTLSKEKKILVGDLELKSKTSYCEATLCLNTNKKKHGKTVYKYYTGCAIISKAVESFYIVLSSPKEGEICIINLRHFFIRHQELDCRMAEVITNGAGERHFPTVHRMLLSRSQIKEEHYQYITPHLHLNSSDIHIREEDLEKLENETESYKGLIEHLIHNIDPIKIYDFKEDYVISNAKQLLSKEETLLFLSAIRKNSYKLRYNKVSNKLDETVRELLLSLGYYNDTNLEE